MLRILFLLIATPLFLASFEPRMITPFPTVGYREIPFEDSVEKSLLFTWYPVDPGVIGTHSQNSWDRFNIAKEALPYGTKLPTVIISHGYTGNPHQMSWLINGLVQRGYLVLAMQHRDLVNGKAHINHWQRAQDIGKMMDLFSKNPLSEHADLNKIGIAGFSLGGTTAIWVAGGRTTKLDTLIPGPEYASTEDYTRADEALPTLNREMMAQDWRDSRIKAAFIMAPAWAWLFDETSLKNIVIPTYFVAAAEDKTLVTPNNAGFFARNIPKSVYQEIPGKVSHFIFISAISEQKRKQTDPDNKLSFLFEEDASVDKEWIQLQLIEEADRFFKDSFA